MLSRLINQSENSIIIDQWPIRRQYYLEEPGYDREEETGEHVTHSLGALLNQSNGDEDPLPQEDEETQGDKEDDAGHWGEGNPGVSLLEKIINNLWSPVELENYFS